MLSFPQKLSDHQIFLSNLEPCIYVLFSLSRNPLARSLHQNWSTTKFFSKTQKMLFFQKKLSNLKNSFMAWNTLVSRNVLAHINDLLLLALDVHTRTDRRTDRRTDGRTDGQTTKWRQYPTALSRPRVKNIPAYLDMLLVFIWTCGIFNICMG